MCQLGVGTAFPSEMMQPDLRSHRGGDVRTSSPRPCSTPCPCRHHPHQRGPLPSTTCKATNERPSGSSERRGGKQPQPQQPANPRPSKGFGQGSSSSSSSSGRKKQSQPASKSFEPDEEDGGGVDYEPEHNIYTDPGYLPARRVRRTNSARI